MNGGCATSGDGGHDKVIFRHATGGPFDNVGMLVSRLDRGARGARHQMHDLFLFRTNF